MVLSKMNRSNIIGILIGYAGDKENVERINSTFNECPYKIHNVVKGNHLFVIFSIPDDHCWWLEGKKIIQIKL